MTERVIISSFNHESLQTISKIAPYIESAALFAEVLVDFTTYIALIPAKALHVSLPTSFRKSVKLALAEGATVRVYTVNDQRDARSLQQLGVQAIFTDDPEKYYLPLVRTKKETKGFRGIICILKYPRKATSSRRFVLPFRTMFLNTSEHLLNN